MVPLDSASDVVAENLALHETVLELERQNGLLLQELEGLNQGVPELATRVRNRHARTRTRTSTSSVEVSDKDDLRCRDARLLWHKGISSVIMANQAEVKRELHRKHAKSQRECRGLMTQNLKLERSFCEAKETSEMYGGLLKKERMALRDVAVAHEHSRVRFVEENQRLADEMCALASERFKGCDTLSVQFRKSCSQDQIVSTNPSLEEQSLSFEVLLEEVATLRRQVNLAVKREEQWKASVSVPWWRRGWAVCCASERENLTDCSLPLVKMEDGTDGKVAKGRTSDTPEQPS